MAIVLWSDANFNPLHREGGDSDADMGVDGTSDFNPLHREGGDVDTLPEIARFYDFNPLHREGGDQAVSWQAGWS